MVTSRDRRNELTNASLDDGPPRNQTEPDTVVEHRESPAGQDNGPPEGAGDGNTIYDLPIDEPALGLNLGSNAFEFACSQTRKKVSCESSPLSAAFG